MNSGGKKAPGGFPGTFGKMFLLLRSINLKKMVLPERVLTQNLYWLGLSVVIVTLAPNTSYKSVFLSWTYVWMMYLGRNDYICENQYTVPLVGTKF